MRIYGIYKDGTDELICRAGMQGDADTENRLMDLGGGEGRERGTNGESSVETYALPHVKQPVGICWMTQGTPTRAL